MRTSSELFDAFEAVQAVQGYTWAEIKEAGGPSSTTLTGLKGRSLDAISTATLRRLDDAFGWKRGTARQLVDDSPELRRTALQGVRDTVGAPRLQQGDAVGRSEAGAPSEVPSTLVPTEQRERNVVRISAQAIGWELSATYTDAEDRLRALEDIATAWAAVMSGRGNGVDSGGDRGP